MGIRSATEIDLPALLAIGQEMHTESPALRHAPFYAEKVEQAFRVAIAQGAAFIHESNGEVDGFFCGLVVERWFSLDKMATDLALFVRPGRRGGFIAYRLLDRFIAWCEENEVHDVQIGITTGVALRETGAFYERMGFKCVGGNYQMRLNGQESDHLRRS